MSKSSSRLGRPGSAGAKSPSLRKELQGNRSCMLRIGERLMRAGSEGNLVQRPVPAQSQSQTPSTGLGQGLNGQMQPPAAEDKPSERMESNSSKDPGNSPSRVSSSSSSAAEDSSTERLLQKKQHNNNSSLLCNPDFSVTCGPAPRSPSTLPRSHAPGAAAAAAGGGCSRDSQLDSLMMQHSDVERKKEVFLDHLRQKYPHHAAIIMGHQERMRDQVRSPRPSENPACAGVLGFLEDLDPLASETMADGEGLLPSAPFTRGCKARASLPVGRSSDHTRERALGVLYLQYGEETKQVRMPSEISSQDILRAMFVTAFPHQLTMKMLQSPNMAIYIKDTSRNVYYDLGDIRNIAPQSCLKAYHKDAAHVFNRHARPANAEGRISKEVLYGSHSPVHTLSSSGRSTLHSLQGSMSPPMVRSMPSSPSRMAYGGGAPRRGGGVVDPSSATLPRERLPGVGRSSALCTSSSSILERRDVKPDEDVSSKSMALVVRGEGGSHYADSYCSSTLDGAGGRLSIASSQCSAAPSLTADMVDAGVMGIPGGLQQYRASVKPLMGYGEAVEHQNRSLHRQKQNRKYGDGQLAPLGTKTPPPSPHRVNEIRMSDGQIIGGVGLVTPDRMSPIRRSLRRDSNGATVEIVNRRSGSASSGSSVFVDSPVGPPERMFQGHVPATNVQSERMKAMEEQIASLAGLVHHALAMGPDTAGAKEAVSENAGRKVHNNRDGVSSEPQDPAALTDSFSPAPLALQAPPSDSGLQERLVSAKRNVCELRLQLNQLRRLQLSNQESVSSMLRMAGQELVVLMCDRLAQSEEAVYRQRAEMDEERILYLATEDRILSQLTELEDYVDHLQRSPSHQSITLRDVEEGAVSLRRIGEALAVLKGEFPELQLRMRSVLRLEVEAVRFLKEEPHKMDSMLKRVKALTETLSALRRCVSESAPPARSAQVEPLKVLETDQGPPRTQSPQSSPKPQPRSSVRAPLPTPPLSGNQAEVGLAGSASPIMARRMKTTAASAVQPSHHHPSPPLTPTHGRDSPTVAKVTPRSREGSPALQRRAGPQQFDGQDQVQESLSEQTHTEIAERQTPEGSLSVETSLSSTSQADQSASSDSSQTRAPNTSIDFDKALQEAQASLMKSIPSLEVSDDREGPGSGQISATALKSELDAPLDLTLQASEEQENTPPKQSDEVDSVPLKPPDTAPVSQLPAATVEPPPPSASPPAAAPPAAAPPASASPSASPNTERSGRPQVEKPRRSSVDKEMKQSPDRAGKSPPPPPPRRFHAVSSGLTTGRSGEVIFTTKKDAAADESDKKKEPPAVPQPKPPRQPPEVKPKPQMCVPPPLAAPTSTPAAASARREEEEEEEEDEEEEDNKFMKELQVFQKCTVREVGSRARADLSASELQNREMELQVTTELSNKNHSPGGNKQTAKGKARISPTSKVANHKASGFAISDHQPTRQLGISNGCSPKLIVAAGHEEQSEGGKSGIRLDKKKEVEDKVVKQVPSLNRPTVKKVKVPPPVPVKNIRTVQKVDEVLTTPPKKAGKLEVLTIPATQKDTDLTVNTPGQINKEIVEPVSSPTSPDRKVKYTAIVTLQKENTQETVTSPKKTSETVVNEAAKVAKEAEKVAKEVEKVVKEAEKKSNMTVIVTLQKENTPEDHSMEPVWQLRKPLSSDQECTTTSPTSSPAPKSPTKQQNQEVREQVSEDQSLYTEEGCSLSPSMCEEEGPPPPPPVIGKFSHRIIKTRIRTKEEDPAKMNGSDMPDSSGEPTYMGHENLSFEDNDDSRPIIVILNEPMDIQSAYKRLSTIFEEDLDTILSAESIEEEDETKLGEDEPGLRKIHITGNGQNSPQSPQNDNAAPGDQDKKTKKKFKFKFPKNKLAAFSQALRTGPNKTGKKTLEVVVYEEEEEIASDGKPAKDNKKQTKESKKFEINNSKPLSPGKDNACDRDIKVSSPGDTKYSKSNTRVEELRKNTFDSINSLEESIKQLEISVDSITAPSSPSSPSSTVSSPPQTPNSPQDQTDTARPKSKVRRERERSPSKRPAPQIFKGPNPPQSKKAKAQPPHETGKTSTKKQTSSSTSSSPAQRSHTKSRHSSSSGSPEKTAKGQQQQATQKQPSQADSRSSRAAGNSSHCVVALRASKIPALCHSSGKQPSSSLSTPHCSDTTDSLQNLSSSSSSSASSPSAPSASSCGKHFLLSPPSNVSKCPSRSSSPSSSSSSSQRSRHQAFSCPLSPSSLVKNSSVSPSASPPRSPSPSSSSSRAHKSFIPSLNLSRLLPSSSHALSPSHANVSPAHHGPRSGGGAGGGGGSSSKRQHRLLLASTSSTNSSTTSSTTSTTTSPHSCYSSSSYSSSSPSSSTSSSLSPTSSSSSPPSPSSSLLPTTVSHGARSVRTSASNPSSPSRGKKRAGSQAVRALRTAAAAASKDAA